MAATRKRKASCTVELRGFTRAELRLLAYGAWDCDLPTASTADQTSAMHAMARLLAAGHRPEPVTVSKVPRVALEALAAILESNLATLEAKHQGTCAAVAKLRARLRRTDRGPAVNPDTWLQRADDVRRVRATLARRQHYTPTDAEIERAAGITPGQLRLWRKRHPDVFAAD